MALWHYTFRFVPRLAFEKVFPSMGLYDIFYEDDILWKNSGVKKDLFDSIECFLPFSKSWCEGRFIYGEQEKSNLSILVKDDGYTVCSVSLRISFIEENYEALLSRLVHFFVENNFYIISEDFHGFLPDLDMMLHEITHSSRIGTYAVLSNRNPK